MNIRALIVLIGIVSILVSITTWVMDLTGLVEQCIYCRTQRTVIGLLGIVMLLPAIKYLLAYIGYVLGFFGSHVASAQMFLNLRHEHFGLMFTLSSCALLWIIFQACLLHCYSFFYKKHSIKVNSD